MIWWLVAAILLWALYFYYTRAYLTRRKMKEYKALFESAGYRVRLDGFQLYTSSMLDTYREGEAKHGNPLYDKITNFKNYDVVICSFLNRAMLEIIHPDLLQAFFASPVHEYHKYRPLLENLERSMGDGLGSSEGDVWRRKRRVMSAVFHFDFLSAIIPKAVTICDQVFDEFDQSHQGLPKTMDIKEIFLQIFGDVILQSFFGCRPTHEKIDGQLVTTYLSNLAQDLQQQAADPFALLFGVRAVSFGIRRGDRQINRRVAKYREYAERVIRERVLEIKAENTKEPRGDVVS